MAASLICLLLITILNLYPSALVAISSAEQNQGAQVLAQNTLEAFAARPFSSLNVGPQSLTGISVPAGYSVTVEVALVDGYETEFLKNVLVTVTWTFRGRDREIKQELYVHPVR